MKGLCKATALMGLVLIIGVYAQGADVAMMNDTIPGLEEVDQNVFRGAQPDEASLRMLKDAGIKKIINFRHEQRPAAREKELVEALDMHYVNIPWTIFGPFREDIFSRFCAEIEDKDNTPVFFHCKRGAERTGVMAAMYKMKYKNMTLDESMEYIDKSDLKWIWRPFVHKKLMQYAALLEKDI